MTCQDCIHYDVCWRIKEVETGNPMITSYHICRAFKDKSRFIELPCKVGDTVYKLLGNKIYEMRAVAIPIMISNSCTHLSVMSTNYRDAALTLELSDFGETVFLTREEAENALKARESK